MRILFFVSSLNAGGAERVATTLANAWAQRGDEVVLVPTYMKKHDSFYPLDDAVRLVWLADCPGRGVRTLPGLGKWLTIRQLIRTTQPDLVVSFLTNVNVNVLIASAGLSVPVIVSERTNPAHSQSAGVLLRFLRRLTYRRARAVVMQTQASVEPFRSLVPGASQLTVIPNPLPPDIPEKASPDGACSRQVVGMGRLVSGKQFDVLIKAFAALENEYLDWSLTLYGDGPLRETLTQQIRQSGLEGRVRLAGRTSEPWNALAQADIFAMTSRVEGFPNVLLEAMALGLPCVAFDCPSGPAELTRHGQDAVLVPLNDLDTLVRSLRKLMQDTEYRQQLGMSAASAVRQRYGLSQVLAQWDELFAAFSGTDSQE